MDISAINQINNTGAGAVVYHARNLLPLEASHPLIYSAHIYTQDGTYVLCELEIAQEDDCLVFIRKLVDTIEGLSAQLPWSYPTNILFEVCSNLIHACFSEVSILLLNDGYTLVVSDQGPGISSPEKALRAGFTSADTNKKQIIRGVGAGLPIVQTYMESQKGTITVESNLNNGTVVTLNINNTHNAPLKELHSESSSSLSTTKPSEVTYPINERQRSVLTAVLHYAEVGPQLIATTLDFGVATAHRDLKVLETHGLIEKLPNKKSKLTQKGFEYIEYLSTH